jgi:hypothetical protein
MVPPAAHIANAGLIFLSTDVLTGTPFLDSFRIVDNPPRIHAGTCQRRPCKASGPAVVISSWLPHTHMFIDVYFCT